MGWGQTHIPCPSCSSSNAYSVNDDGWGICFSCGTRVPPRLVQGGSLSTFREQRGQMNSQLLEQSRENLVALNKRGISKETCEKFGYTTQQDNTGKAVQVAPYYSGRELVAQKVRYANKDFRFLGEAKRAGLFGQQLWGDGGKMIVITEGEIDCLSVSQLQGNKWPVVSVKNGAQSAKKALQEQLEWLNKFESIVLMFDMDEPGQKAAAECAPLFPPGKCKIAHLPLKDANEMLVNQRGGEVIDAIWKAKSYRPDGLVTVDDIMADIEADPEQGLPWCFPALTQATLGRRYGEIYALGAGTGVGKTDVLTQQIAFDVDELDLSVGCLFLEQKPSETAKRIAGKIAGKRFHVSDGTWTHDELMDSVTKLSGKVTFYDNFGSTEWDQVADKIRFMAVSSGIRIFYLDHLTAMADTADEKGSLEQIMKEMAGLANELSIIITFVSHLTTPEGKPHEEGGRVTIRHFKGSRAIGFWSFFMFGLERNQQAGDESSRHTTTFRVLKDRYTGQSTGLTFGLSYDSATGLLKETTLVEQEEELSDMF